MGRRTCYLVLTLLGAGYFFLFMVRTPWRSYFYQLLPPNLNQSDPYNEGEQEGSAPEAPRRFKILILSYARCGTSFLGDLFNSYPNSFYHFEPIHTLDVVRNRSEEAVSLLKSLFDCQFPPRYLRWIKSHQNFKKMERNTQFWRACHSGGIRNVTCYQADAVSHFCREQTMHVAKVIRLPLGLVAPLLEAMPDLKVIFNVRDPRGMINSRLKPEIYSWCKKLPQCISPRKFCKIMEGDFQSFCALKARHASRMCFLRYEDVAANPMEYAERLFSWLGIKSLPAETARFVRIHTSARHNELAATSSLVDAPYRTVRQSNLTAFAWQGELDAKHLKEVSETCKKPIEMFQYPSDPKFSNFSKFGQAIELSCPPNG